MAVGLGFTARIKKTHDKLHRFKDFIFMVVIVLSPESFIK